MNVFTCLIRQVLMFLRLNNKRKQKQLPWIYNKFSIQLIAEKCTPLPLFLFCRGLWLRKYNFIQKSASFVLGFTSFWLPIPPESLTILQIWDSWGTWYHLSPLQDFNYFAVTSFAIAIKNTLLLTTLLSALCKSLQKTVPITTLPSEIY